MLGKILVYVAALIMVTGTAAALTSQEQLGRNLFFDINLSEPAGQGCASCHDPNTAFAEPDKNLPVSQGVVDPRDTKPKFGTRNSPSAAYAIFNGQFTLKSGIMGGQFWDGRAANLTEQAKGPFVNPVEMNNTNRSQVIAKISNSAYSALFEQICGPNAFDPANTDRSYNCMAGAIASFEGTSELNKFTSKFDAFLNGAYTLTAQEDRGKRLFSGSGKCAHCHPDNGDPVVFSDFKFHNIGIPKNSEYPFPANPADFTADRGLGGFLNDPRQNGRFKTPHLRNINDTGPYMHNGVLKNLKQVVHFYNTRDVLGVCSNSTVSGFGITCWPTPETMENLDSQFVGNLGLTDSEENAIVAFMQTFTDGFTP